MDSKQQLIFAIDSGNNRIKVIDGASKAVLRHIYHSPDINPCGICVFESTIMVSDCISHKVNVLDLDSGETIRTIGAGEGAGPGQLDHPGDVMVYAPRGCQPHEVLLLVCDSSHPSISAFNLFSGEFSHSIGSGLRNALTMAIWAPTSLEGGGDDVDTSQLIVNDFDNNRIVVIDILSGSILRSIYCDNGGGLTIYRPMGGNDAEVVLVVVRYSEPRIVVFQLLSGVRLLEIDGYEDRDDEIVHFNEMTMFCPSTVVIRSVPLGESGGAEIVVNDLDNHSLQVFDLTTGKHVQQVCTGPGEGDEEFNVPEGLFITDAIEQLPYILK